MRKPAAIEDPSVPRLTEPDRFASDNPRSILNLIPSAMRELLLKHQAAHPELFLMNEDDLWTHLKKNWASVTSVDQALRKRFWNEYDKVMESGADRIVIASVYANIVDAPVWFRFVSQPEKMAWLMCVPTIDREIQESCFSFSLKRLAKALDEEPYRKDGSFDVKTATLQFAIHKYLDERINGQTVARSQNLTIAEHRMVQAAVQSSTEESLVNQLNKINSQAREQRHLPAVPPKVVVSQVVEIKQTENPEEVLVVEKFEPVAGGGKKLGGLVAD